MLATASAAATCVDGDTNEWVDCTCPNTEPGVPRYKATANTGAANTGCGTVSADAFAELLVENDPDLVPFPNGVQQPTAGVPIGLHDDAGVASTITAVWASNTTPGVIRTSNVTVGATTFPGRSVSSETLAIAAIGTFVPALLIGPDHPCAAAAVTGLFDFVGLACAIPVNATATSIHCNNQTRVVPHTNVVAVWGLQNATFDDPVCHWVVVDDTATVYSASGAITSPGVPLRGGTPVVAVTGIEAVGPSLDGRRIVAATATDVVVFDIATGLQVNRTTWATNPLQLATAPALTVPTLGCALPGSPCSAEVVCCPRTLPLQTLSEPPVVSLSPMVAVHQNQLNRTLTPLPLVNVSFYGGPGNDTLSDSVPTEPIPLPAPETVTEANVTGRRAMGFNQPGGDAALRAFLGNCDLAKCAQCDQSRIARDDSTPLTFAERDPTVRGQSANKSVLGTYYRNGSINEYGWLTTRGGAWAVPPSFAFDTRRNIWDGATYDPANRSTAFWNRWYVDQANTSGTPLWPTSAKSDFGLCCAYLYAAYGTNGYRPYKQTLKPPQPGDKTTQGVADTSEHNAGQPGWQELAQFPPFPEAFDVHSQCYTGGLALTAGLSVAQEAEACDTTFSRTLPPVGCRQPFNESDWMSDDEKKVAAVWNIDDQALLFTAALWPAEGCITDYDCELPQLGVMYPRNCTHWDPITKESCRLCVGHITHGTANCMPLRNVTASYVLPAKRDMLCPPDTDIPYCFRADVDSCLGDSPSTCKASVCRKSNRRASCDSIDNCVKRIVKTNIPFKGSDCTFSEPLGVQHIPCPATGIVHTCGDSTMSVPFVFGVPISNSSYVLYVPAVNDTYNAFTSLLQRRAYAQCRACAGRPGGKCCDTSAYTKWRALGRQERISQLDNIYQPTMSYPQPARTTRQYPFVWGGEGADVNIDQPTFPPIFPPNAFTDTQPMQCDVVTEELPLGCAHNVSNIAHKAGSTVAKRTIIEPNTVVPDFEINFKNRPGATTCPRRVEVPTCATNASLPIAWSNPQGCYNDTATGRVWYSDGTGTSPIPHFDKGTFVPRCFGDAESLEDPVVTCQGPGQFLVDFFASGSYNLGTCDDPTDWRCRLKCN